MKLWKDALIIAVLVSTLLATTGTVIAYATGAIYKYWALVQTVQDVERHLKAIRGILIRKLGEDFLGFGE